MYKVGIIGCGKIAQVRHIPEYIANEKTVLTSLFDLNHERAEVLAEKYGATAYDSVEALLHSGIDAVSICTANVTHAELAIEALECGLDVLCEKPMSTNLEDAIRMVETAEKKGRVLMIGQNQRLAPAHMRAHELIKNGEIGKVVTFRTTFGHGGPETWSIDPGANTWFFDSKKAAMGAMADLGVHKTDLIDYLLDDEVMAVTAHLTTLDKRNSAGELIGVDDNAFCIYEMKGGAVGTMNASWTHYGAEDNSTVIYGTLGIMRIYSDPAHSIVIEKRNGERQYYDIDAIQTNDNQTSSGVIDAFAEALEKRESPLSGASVLPAMKAVFAAIESGKKGERILI